MKQNANEIYHYGILGMKWGRRKARPNTSQDYKDYQNIKKKKVSEMSNAELRKLNERQNLERQYKSLNQNTIQKGLKIAGATAATLGTVVGLYENGHKIIKIGKNVVDKISKK